MSTTDNINIREIVARFQNSAEVIEELRGRLQSLARTDDLHGVSLRTAQVAAQSLEETSGQIKTALDLLRNSLTTADSALTTATAFMKTTDLSEVSRLLQTIATSQAAADKSQEQGFGELRRILESEFSQIRAELERSRAERASAEVLIAESTAALSKAEKELDDLRAKIASIPDRVRSKYGL